ncbi:hypothetical protein KUTeg_023444 [Tegillarca granosa]|uniref:C2H2-type domain-containing protein n=1 Tax=Tegillarca granosa TaxID=220873 RepID=A0ABQ9E545_TEGGR|nr:hypothetical protein KUTeg_023444 [Tegillarca granosa]
MFFKEVILNKDILELILFLYAPLKYIEPYNTINAYPDLGKHILIWEILCIVLSELHGKPYVCFQKEGEYKCHLCHKSFDVARYLKDHIRIIHNPPQFECSTCGEKFKWKRTYSRHIEKCPNVGKSKICKYCCRKLNVKLTGG